MWHICVDFNASFWLKKASSHSKIPQLKKPPHNTDKEAHTAACATAFPFYAILDMARNAALRTSVSASAKRADTASIAPASPFHAITGSARNAAFRT